MPLRIKPALLGQFVVYSSLVLWLTPLQAQDSLFYANGRTIVGQVEEVGVDLVRFRTPSGGSSVVIVAEKRDLLSVKLEGGQVFMFNNVSTDVPASPEFMARKQVIGLDALAPALNHITLGYERVIGTRVSITAKVGYIGVWMRDTRDGGQRDQGWLVKFGPRFILPPASKRYSSAREDHPLAGWYLRPELMFSYWVRRNNFGTNRMSDYSSAALNLVIGRQVLLGERFTFDIYGGLGYGVQWRDGEVSGNNYGNYRELYSYSHAFFGSRIPLTGSGGLLFGYVF